MIVKQRPAPKKASWVPQKFEDWAMNYRPGMKNRIWNVLRVIIYALGFTAYAVSPEEIAILFNAFWIAVAAFEFIWQIMNQYWRNIAERRAAKGGA